jgi:hypothetical protein
MLKNWGFEKLHFITWTNAYIKFFMIQYNLLLPLSMLGGINRCQLWVQWYLYKILMQIYKISWQKKNDTQCKLRVHMVATICISENMSAIINCTQKTYHNDGNNQHCTGAWQNIHVVIVHHTQHNPVQTL